MNNNFYVYALYDPDEELPFYIGKGQGIRASKSITLAGSGNNKFKKNKIKKILNSGNEVELQFIEENLTEEKTFKRVY